MADFDTGRRDLRANRWTPFQEEILFEGFNYSGATFAGSVRAVRDSGGAALAAFSFTAPSVATANGLDTTSVTMSLTEAAVEGLPLPASPELGDDVVLYWDMHITPSGRPKFRALEGTFTVAAGVHQ